MTETLNVEKAYKLRKLQACDIFAMSKIISAIGIDEFKACFESDDVKQLITTAGGGVDITESVGFTIVIDLANIIMNNLPKAEADIYTFLSELSDKTREELEQMPMNTFIEMVCDVIRKDEFKDFIKVVSKLFK